MKMLRIFKKVSMIEEPQALVNAEFSLFPISDKEGVELP